MEKAVDIFREKLNQGLVYEAEQYLIKIFESYYRRKKIPALRHLIRELQASREFAYLLDEFQLKTESLLGKKCDDFYPTENWHFFYWNSEAFHLKQKIIESVKINSQFYKYVYEYLLKYHWDFEVTWELLEVGDWSLAQKEFLFNCIKQKFPDQLKFAERRYLKKQLMLDSKEVESLLSQWAFDVFSGKRPLGPNSIEDEKRMLYSLTLLSKEELEDNGKEMLIAFRFMEFYRVCHYLIDLLLEKEKNVREIVGLRFVEVEILIEEGRALMAMHLINDVMRTLPLVSGEKEGLLRLKERIEKNK